MDFSPWDRTKSFRLHEAACLIAGVLPLSKRVPDREELPSQAIPVYQALATSYVLWVNHHDKPDDPSFPKEWMLKGLPQHDTGEISLAVPLGKMTGEFVAREELHRWIQATGRTSAYLFRPRHDSATWAANEQVSQRESRWVVKLSSDDVEKGGAFVKIGSVAGAIAKALGSTNQAQAERKNFARINSGVQQGLLNPLDSETLEPLSRKDYGAGIVPFRELVAWGKKPSGETPATQLFHFQLDEAALYPDVVSRFERIEEVERLIEYWKSRDDTTGADAVAIQDQLQPLRAELASLERANRVLQGDCAEPEPPLQQTLPDEPMETVESDAIVFGSSDHATIQMMAPDPAPVKKPKAKRPNWWDVSSAYIVDVLQSGQYATCKELYCWLLENAGPGSPFDKGIAAYRGKLFVREIARPLSLKAVQNRWADLRGLAEKVTP